VGIVSSRALTELKKESNRSEIVMTVPVTARAFCERQTFLAVDYSCAGGWGRFFLRGFAASLDSEWETGFRGGRRFFSSVFAAAARDCDLGRPTAVPLRELRGGFCRGPVGLEVPPGIWKLVGWVT
jgi:hypothetical protein